MTTEITNDFFDFQTPRTSADSIKFNRRAMAKPSDVIPMWVADMDFRVPPAVTQKLVECAEHSIFGYYHTGSAYDVALCDWFRNRHNFQTLPGWNVQMPNVLFGITAAIGALSLENDAVMICQPVYHPFAHLIPAAKRKLVVHELRLKDGAYYIDFNAFEEDIKKNDVKLLLFCSPHNPIGRVWSKAELMQVAEICVKYGVLILSDEIHCDLILPGNTHTMFASLNDEVADRVVTFTAPTKTFNLAGLQNANAFIRNQKLRKAVEAQCQQTGYHQINTMGAVAAQAAYTHGKEWLEALLNYLQGNVDYLRQSLKELNGGISLIEPQGTYLMWLDCRSLKLADPELDDFFINKAKIWMNSGESFGAGGSGFMRMNIACPRVTLQKAMENLKRALS